MEHLIHTLKAELAPRTPAPAINEEQLATLQARIESLHLPNQAAGQRRAVRTRRHDRRLRGADDIGSERDHLEGYMYDLYMYTAGRWQGCQARRALCGDSGDDDAALARQARRKSL